MFTTCATALRSVDCCDGIEMAAIRRITAAEVRPYAIAIGAFAAAMASMRLTWPLFDHTPFALLFSAVFVASKFGSEVSSDSSLPRACPRSGPLGVYSDRVTYLAPPIAGQILLRRAFG